MTNKYSIQTRRNVSKNSARKPNCTRQPRSKNKTRSLIIGDDHSEKKKQSVTDHEIEDSKELGTLQEELAAYQNRNKILEIKSNVLERECKEKDKEMKKLKHKNEVYEREIQDLQKEIQRLESDKIILKNDIDESTHVWEKVFEAIEDMRCKLEKCRIRTLETETENAELEDNLRKIQALLTTNKVYFGRPEEVVAYLDRLNTNLLTVNKKHPRKLKSLIINMCSKSCRKNEFKNTGRNPSKNEHKSAPSSRNMEERNKIRQETTKRKKRENSRERVQSSKERVQSSRERVENVEEKNKIRQEKTKIIKKKENIKSRDIKSTKSIKSREGNIEERNKIREEKTRMKKKETIGKREERGRGKYWNPISAQLQPQDSIYVHRARILDSKRGLPTKAGNTLGLYRKKTKYRRPNYEYMTI